MAIDPLKLKWNTAVTTNIANMTYLAFNLLYRKFGRLSEKIFKLLPFEKIGQVGEFLAYI
ncbi:MAG: hypothetical protein E7E64_11475 [Clostridium celatum]|nr:hypothetical protein [Clostridium celatum]MDU4980485.1 hypothetical protein [Clostridium celatum]